MIKPFGSIIFSVKIDFFRKNRTKEFNFDFWITCAEEMDPADVNANKVMGVLAYLGILVLIPIFAAKGSKFARSHANQGLILLILEIVIYL